jgi:hypothetical protein
MRQRRYFQWLDGENAGQVETRDNITCTDGEYFFNFKSGEACNQRFISQMTRNAADLKGKVMIPFGTTTIPQKVFDAMINW